VHYVDYGFFLCGLFNLICANISITSNVLYIILEPHLSVFNKGVKRKCLNHGGFLWACKSQNFQLPLKMEASQRHNFNHIVIKVQCLVSLRFSESNFDYSALFYSNEINFVHVNLSISDYPFKLLRLT